MRQKTVSQKKIITFCTLALLTAMQVVLARFAVIPIGDMVRFSVSFIPVVIAARLYGVVGGMCVYGLGDFVGAIAIPTTGAFFPGYTLTAVIAGFIFGIFLRGSESETKKSKIIKIVSSVLTSQFICSFLLNSFWRAYQSGTPYTAVLMTRLPQCLIISVLQIAFMLAALDKIVKVVGLMSNK